MKIENAKSLPKIYYGLHFAEGVAEYKEPEVNNGQPYRIFVGEEVMKGDRKSTRLNSSHIPLSRMPSSA